MLTGITIELQGQGQEKFLSRRQPLQHHNPRPTIVDDCVKFFLSPRPNAMINYNIEDQPHHQPQPQGFAQMQPGLATYVRLCLYFTISNANEIELNSYGNILGHFERTYFPSTQKSISMIYYW
jgi:hypothetical protein